LESIVLDIGNSRLKWASLSSQGGLSSTGYLPLNQPESWTAALGDAGIQPGSTRWWISSVNPPVANQFEQLLKHRKERAAWFHSAADVPIPHRLTEPKRAGADRALAVLAAIHRHGGRGPGHVIACGTAITVEAIDAGGVWLGGAIAPGLAVNAHALRDRTAQLPAVVPTTPPRPYGATTEPAIAAGIFWGAVGAIRELIDRQAEFLETDGSWIAWTGGDVAKFAPWVEGPGALILPNLVLEGLALLALNSGSESPD
jgi:type III pantothenate kinase